MVQQLTVIELDRLQRAGQPVYLVDVRQPWEREQVALPDHLHIPLSELTARAHEVQPPEGALLVIYCHHGVRSMAGAAMLERQGHDGIASLAGGIDAWSLEVDAAVPRY